MTHQVQASSKRTFLRSENFDGLAGPFRQYGLRFQIPVLSRPDAGRGEALVAVSNEPRLTLEEIRAAIKAGGLSNLYAPRELKYVHDIPKMGGGKVNHRELQKLAGIDH
jgi:acyl-[acyl-carrier-protein]-phospholipid O-acyltransferase/long-chain-fatty-acid--[acyl-carrier-protein] ligase